MTAPNPQAAIERYRHHAPGYDESARRTMRLRGRTIEKLALRPGQTVLDVGCGTGLSLDLLAPAVGPNGRVIGVELSPEMISRARARVAEHRWAQVELVEAGMEEAQIRGPLDAVLFNYTHDVLRSKEALANIFAAARPGARVAVAGMKFVSWWLAPVNLYVMAKGRPYMTTFEGLARPWSHLEGYLQRFETEPTLLGTGYIGWGTVRGKER